MALAAERTRRIQLGTGLIIPAMRLAPVTANGIATITRLAPVVCSLDWERETRPCGPSANDRYGSPCSLSTFASCVRSWPALDRQYPLAERFAQDVIGRMRG